MIKNIIFDFDGVILDSIPIKTEAFRKLFANFPKEQVDKIIDYHIRNGGKSRYLKIKYFFENILGESISDENILSYADKYSELTKLELSKSKYLIEDSLNFIQNNYKRYQMHIASGADEKDLLYICKKLNLEPYFLSIHGSPEIKTNIVTNILDDNQYIKDETILVGDSINDYEAATANNIEFFAYNNEKLMDLKCKYLPSFSKLENEKKF